ncbi:MAG: LLM class flavin-dependent oxidoreductase [Thermomicrobiales bacterium]|nr:LLM class flavin-dependent oxidoreductase [Thermomicrobiales bacterium]
MRFSLRLNNDLPIADYVTLARAAEAAGFDQFWVSHDLFLRSAPVILAAVAQATSRIEIGSCILNPYSMHPSEIAMAAATLDELSGGRFNLGLGAGAAEFLKWVHIERDRPLAATRAAILQIRSVLDGEAAPSWEPEAYLRFGKRPGNRRIPIYLAAMSPRMLRLSGELADGALPLLFPPQHYATVAPYIAEGAASVGRGMDEIDLAACIWCSIAESHADAERVLRDKIAYYGHALSPLIWDRLGVLQEDFRPLEHALMTERDPERARALVDERMLRIGIVGTAGELLPQLESLVDMGARHISFGPPLGPSPLAAVEAIGRIIIPAMRDAFR